jgi:hypothetical protein
VKSRPAATKATRPLTHAELRATVDQLQRRLGAIESGRSENVRSEQSARLAAAFSSGPIPSVRAHETKVSFGLHPAPSNTATRSSRPSSSTKPAPTGTVDASDRRVLDAAFSFNGGRAGSARPASSTRKTFALMSTEKAAEKHAALTGTPPRAPTTVVVLNHFHTSRDANEVTP